MINPDDYVIKRRRKKYRFAKFANSTRCYEYEEWLALPEEEKVADCVEMGAGTGNFSVELAKNHPDRRYVAIDVKSDRLQKGAYYADDLSLPNVRFIRARADQINRLFPDKSVNEIWLTFPDPFPKKRSAGRRLTHQNFLSMYTQVLKRSGVLRLKHDNGVFFAWSLEQLVAHRWQLQELTFDLHESIYHEEYKIKTTYEQRWLDEGRLTHYCSATVPKRS